MRSSKLLPFVEIANKETSVRTLQAFVLIAECQLKDGNVMQDVLTDLMQVSKSACGRCCRQLEQKHLINRVAPKGQGHRRLITLTASGEELFRSMV